MIYVVFLAALVSAPLLTLGTAWLGPAAPDPFVPAAVWAAQCLRVRQLPWAAVALGWMRAFVLAEPAGGQVLCALLALLLAARVGPAGSSGRPLLTTAVVIALSWWAVAALLSWVAGVLPGAAGNLLSGPSNDGSGLLLGALLLLPSPLLAAWRMRRARAEVFAR
ncbi:MAG: hypothetical protein DRQ55_05840 [Planctomycetota bacterium]|nr:MAG: hypothetical protein DRQ55_05840 [Planctomycetota bacterium]